VPSSPDVTDDRTSGSRADDGLGCRTLTVALAVLVGFAVAATATGLSLALGSAPGPTAERIGFLLYGAGAPVSALFAMIAGELPLAPLTDLVVWVAAAVAATRIADRRGTPIWKPLTVIVGASVAWGVVASSALERI